MKITKILNNNVVIARDDQGKEVVAMKLGLGFHRKAGDHFPKTDDLKLFVLSDEVKDQYTRLMKDINPNALELAERIISFAVHEKGMILNDIIHLTLADHIDGLLSRLSSKINMTNQLTVEIRRVYKKEFEIGLYAKQQIEEQTGYELLIDEATFVALHFVNSSKSEDKSRLEAEIVIRFVKDVIAIFERFFNKKIDEESLSYLRFVRHLKFLVHRICDGSEYEEDPTLYESISKAYPRSAECVDKIVRAIELKYHKSVSIEEKAYLTIYVEKLNRE